jgi:hypothetical protein
MESIGVSLSPDEQEVIRSIEVLLTKRARFPITFNKLIKLWGDFITEVETGYCSSIDEYTNDLTSRDLIDELLQAVPDSTRSKLTTQVDSLDQRFLRATQRDIRQLLGKRFKVGASWWWSRIPVLLTGTLASDLQ